jgi:hypothetical protein
VFVCLRSVSCVPKVACFWIVHAECPCGFLYHVLQESYDISGYLDNPRDISPGVHNSKNSRKQIYIVLYVEMHKLDAFLE